MHKIGLGFIFLAVCALSAFAEDVIDVTDGWAVSPVPANDIKDVNVFPPAKAFPNEDKTLDDLADEVDDDFGVPSVGTYKPKPKVVALSGLVPLSTPHRGNDAANAFNDTYNCWYKKTVKIPAEWKGSFVTFTQEIGGIDLAVFVNGKLAGVALAPVGVVDLSSALNYGQDNEIRLFATNKGVGVKTGGIKYHGRDDYCGHSHFFSRARISKRTPAILEDAFVDSSVRQGKVTVRCQVFAKNACKAEISAVFTEDAGGAVAKKLSQTCELKAGINDVDLAADWKNAKLWEPSDPFLYRCEVTMKSGDVECEAPTPFLFGFREVWRDKGQLMFNGHPLSVRGWWNAGIHDRNDWADYKAAGFNAVYQTHQHESRFRMKREDMEDFARNGILVFIGAPTIVSCRDAAVNPDKQAEYARYCEYWARSVRNYPSAIGVSVGVNMMCAAWWTMGARDMGKYGGKMDNIGAACAFVKKFHPNCLAFAHGDGNICDIGNSNFYFNFTPLQERLEWYSDWYDRRDRDNTILYWPAEYGQPYYGSWFGGGQPTMTEFLAIYYGEDAYRAELPRMLSDSRKIAYSKAGNFYGGWADGEKQGERVSLYELNPLGGELRKKFTQEVGRSFRAWHARVSPQYLDDISVKPGNDNWASKYNHELVVFLGGKPDEGRQRFADRTHAYRGGTTAVKSIVAIWDGLGNETVKAVWKLVDESGKTLVSGTKDVALGPSEVKWEPFEIALPEVKEKTKAKLSVTFSAPHLAKGEESDSFDIEIYPAFNPMETATPQPILALYDPRGESAEALLALGVQFRKVDSLEALVASQEKRLVIGRRALDAFAETNFTGSAAFAALEGKVKEGKKLLILDQKGDTWKRMGFEPEDSAPRQFYNVALSGVTDDELAYWAGSPMPMREGGEWGWGPDWGPAQRWHKGGRGWRWTHTHALSLSTLLIPQRTAFRPLIKGEFDMAYSSLMRASLGKGELTVCALAFEGRVGKNGDPAATKVFAAMLNDFLEIRPDEIQAKRKAPERHLLTAGADGKRIAETLGFNADEFTGKAGKDTVILVGADAETKLDELKAVAKSGAKVLVVGNDRIAGEAGFTAAKHYEQEIRWKQKRMEFAEDHAKDFKRPKAPTDIDGGLSLDGDDMSLDEEKAPEKQLPRRPKGMKDNEIPLVWYVETNKVEKAFVHTFDTAAFDKFPFAGVGLSLLRWRESPRPMLLSPQAGWVIAGDGAFGITEDGNILLDQIPVFRINDERVRGGTGNKGDPIGQQNYSLTLDNTLRRLSLVLLNWGVQPDDGALHRIFTGEGAQLQWSACRHDPYGYVYW